MNFFDDWHRVAVALESIASSFARIADAAVGKEVVGIVISPGKSGESKMAKQQQKPKVSFAKKPAAGKGSAAAAAAAPPPQHAAAAADVMDFVLEQDGTSTCTVWGVDRHHNRLDISGVAKLDPPPTSSDSSKITVDPPSGMQFAMHAVALTTPGTPCVISATATFDDGSVGPFHFDLPCDVVAGGPTGIEIVPGTPTIV